MDDIATTSRARKFWMFVASAATVYTMLYAGSALQTQIDLCGGTNDTAVATYHLIESIVQPIVEWIKEKAK